MKYLVIELQTNTDGSVGNLVWAFDERNQAEPRKPAGRGHKRWEI